MSLKHLRDYVDGLPGHRWDFPTCCSALAIEPLSYPDINLSDTARISRFFMVWETPDQEYREEVDETTTLAFAEEMITHLILLRDLLKKKEEKQHE